MTTFYTLLKASLDPIIFILILITAGFFISLRKGKKRSDRIVFLVIFLVLYGASISPAPNVSCYFLEKDYLINENNDVEKLDVVIVLGGGVSDNEYLEETMPSQKTSSRLLHAIQMSRKSEADYLVCAGKGTGKMSEAEVMAIGKGKVSDEGKVIPPEVKVGDKILFGKYSGSEITIDGKEYLILKEDDILAIVK